MIAFLRRHATPLTAVFFLVTLATGLALLSEDAAKLVRAVHAWASVLLLLPVGLHLHRNWRGMQGYWRRLVLRNGG